MEPLRFRQMQLENQKTPLAAQKQTKQVEISQSKAHKKRIAKIRRISSFRQFIILSARNLTILGRDRTSLILMLLIAPVVGSVDFIIAPIVGKTPFDYVNGNAAYANVSLFFLCVYTLMVGSMSQMREIVKEASIYRRERLVNLRIFPYVASKVWVGLLLAFYHAAAFTLIHYAAFKMPGGLLEFGEIYVTLVLAVMTGMMVGLIASAISNNPGVTPLVLICLVTPMFLLSGGLAPTPVYLSGWSTAHWALQGLLGISGLGSDVARDQCWQMDKSLRDAMTLEDKAYFQCPCLGLNIFNQNSCNFPGLGAFYVPQISESAPQSPPALPAAPPEPALPAPPDPVQDTSNQVQVVQYLNALKKYQQDVGKIQASYRTQMDIYQGSAIVYQNLVVQYQEDLARYNVARVTAVSAGEGLINGIASQSKWAWVNKRDPLVYYPWVINTWIAEVILVVAYFSIILLLVRLKDVH